MTATLSGSTITVTGTPTTAGTFSNISVSVTDTAGAVATQTYSMTINPPVAITPAALPTAFLGTPYNQAITATGGTGDKTVTYSVTGTLPPGLSLTPPSPTTNTFAVTGTPREAGTATIAVTATDTTGATVTQVVTVTAGGLSPSRPRWVP